MLLVSPGSFTPTVEAFTQLIHPDDRQELWRKTEQSIASHEVFTHEYRITRPDGMICWIANRSQIRVDDKGEPELSGVAMDITERKQSEQQIQLLLAEVNHRAKNMLSVVLARKTAFYKPDNFIATFERRIQALSANQDILVRNNWRAVPLDDLVRSQIAHFGEAYDTRIAIQGPPLCVSASASQTIGMALHELATNAAKYGALSTAAGLVEINWALTEKGGDLLFSLSWTEKHGPRVVEPAHRGFGSTVIVDVVRRTFKADVFLDYVSAGLVWRFECAADRVLESK